MPSPDLTPEQVRAFKHVREMNADWARIVTAELQRLWAAEDAHVKRIATIGDIQLCAMCGGSGTLPGGTDEYPASACCHHGHSKECVCGLCLWVSATYIKARRITKLERSSGNAFVEGAKWWEFKKSGATMWQADQAAATAEAERRGYVFKPSIEKALEAKIAELERELAERSHFKDWLNEIARAVYPHKRDGFTFAGPFIVQEIEKMRRQLAEARADGLRDFAELVFGHLAWPDELVNAIRVQAAKERDAARDAKPADRRVG